MTCRRICRELVWMTRFGELGPKSQPHLDHLAGCASCRDEVGFDRALVQQLRVALARRVADANPSPTAWERIRARAQAPERAPVVRIFEWSSTLLARLRTATAMAGTGLALLLALNMQIVPGALPPSGASGGRFEPAALPQVPRIPRQQSALSSLAELTEEWNVEPGNPRPPDPESVLTVVGRPPLGTPEQGSQETVEEAPGTSLRLVFRPMQTPERGAAAVTSGEEAAAIEAEVVGTEPGEPA